MTTQLVPFLQRFGVKALQTKSHRLVFQTGTEGGKTYEEDVAYAMQTLKPFLQRWGCAGGEYEESA